MVLAKGGGGACSHSLVPRYDRAQTLVPTNCLNSTCSKRRVYFGSAPRRLALGPETFFGMRVQRVSFVPGHRQNQQKR